MQKHRDKAQVESILILSLQLQYGQEQGLNLSQTVIAQNGLGGGGDQQENQENGALSNL